MSYEINNEAAIEPVPIQDTFITGVAKVEFLGKNNVRITLCSEEEGQRVIVGKIIVAVDDIPAVLAAVMKATWNRLTHIPLFEVAMANRIGRH